MDATDIDQCFRLLKLRRGADLATVKQAYRQNLYKCHPDRFQGRPDLLPVAERKTKRLIEVYGILEKWYEDHGGVDPGFPQQTAGRGQEPPEPDLDDEPGRAEASGERVARWAKIGGLVAAAGSFAIFVWSFVNGPKPVEPLRPAAAVPAAPVAAAATPPPAADPSTERAAQLSALLGARDKARVDWTRTYTEKWEAERAAALGELGEARAQYARDVTDRSARIGEAEGEQARRLEQARLASAARRQAYARDAEAARGALREAYDRWLLSRGGDAVALIRKIREREHTGVGVFSTTEDPAKIFAFWTADEAGGPEVNIAAKSGIAVRQPDSRYFPNFRSNIHLYEPEGGVLVAMMEEIVERHDELWRRIDAGRKEEESELARWDELHPATPEPLQGELAAVLAARDRARDRLSTAEARADRAARALAEAGTAFDGSDRGREFAARIAAARREPGSQGPAVRN